MDSLFGNVTYSKLFQRGTKGGIIMNLGCMILYHPMITSKTKIKLIQAIFPVDTIEILEEENNTVILYAWNIKQEQIWQAVAELVSTDIICGYGFGRRKKEAKKEAVNKLKKWIAMDTEAIKF